MCYRERIKVERTEGIILAKITFFFSAALINI